MHKICQYLRPISISLSLNTEKDDIWLALKLIFMPWLWSKGNAILELENKFKNYLGVKYAISFNSGRSSLFAILKSLELKTGDEVLLQALTCNAAVNPILWLGLQPIFVDCNEDDFNINIDDLMRKITPKIRVLMVQHTFGLPADMDKILEICRENNLILIEDCAHSLGAEYKGKKVGTFGKISFFSFSRDKIISSIYGGMVATNDDVLAEKIKNFQREISYPPRYWIFQQLLHPVLINWVVLPIYNFCDLGKIFLVLSQWLHILSKAVHWKEKRGERPDYFPKALPNALALLAINQFKKIERFNENRKKIANFYYKELGNTSFELPRQFSERKNVFLRFTIKHPKTHEIIYEAWHRQNMLLGDWYTTPIAPYDTKLDKMKYKFGGCPMAEKLAKKILNLPTHINISENDLKRIISFLLKFS